LFIYYAGHGYTKRQRNQNAGYITGIDTPAIDGTEQAYDAARKKAIPVTNVAAHLESARAKSILILFDSCFAGAIFTNRGRSEPLTKDTVDRRMENPARDIITAGSSEEPVPAHSPIPKFFLMALKGDADPYGFGVISPNEIHTYLFGQVAAMKDIKLTPQVGKLPHPDFVEGSFLFRVTSPATVIPTEKERIQRYLEAVKGDYLAQTARLYEMGHGEIKQNYDEAARLYGLAAKQGNAYAQYRLGAFHERGLGGLRKNVEDAAAYYKVAADQRLAQAQADLAFLYVHRQGMKPDYPAAKALYESAAKQGLASAEAHLGYFYENGLGVKRDDRKAAQLYKHAADQGVASARFNLGIFYLKGCGGLPKDKPKAIDLFKQAAEQGDKDAQMIIGKLQQNIRITDTCD
jgi:hypothetical protein